MVLSGREESPADINRQEDTDMTQITLGMVWNRDGHEFTVTKMFKNGKVQITETWISEDTWQECKHSANYNIGEDESGQFAWQDKYKEYAFDENEENGYRWWARMYAVGADYAPEMEEETEATETTNNSKEDTKMANAQVKGAQVEVQQIEVNGVKYTTTRPNYYYKNENGKQVRIPKAEFDAAYDAWMAEVGKEIAKQAEEKAKQAKAKKQSKPRRSKDIAFEGTGFAGGITLTAKQVAFIKRMPEDDFYGGIDKSALWIDVFCDTVADEFNAMSVGAMVSTLREKQLITVSKERVNGRTCKYMEFTETGKEVARQLGLN